MTVYYNSGEALEQRVMNVKELAAKAREFEWNPAIPFKYWVRAADAIYKEVLCRKCFHLNPAELTTFPSCRAKFTFEMAMCRVRTYT